MYGGVKIGAFSSTNLIFLNRNPFWQKLHMDELQKLPGYKDGSTQNMSLCRHKGKSGKILYIKNNLSYRGDI